MCHAEMQMDPAYFPNPETFDGERFYKLRQNQGESEKHQFASTDATIPWWGVGKFSCPGRFWASAQIKLILMALLRNYEVRYPDGQTEAPEHTIADEWNKVSVTQAVVLRPTTS
jgi:ent-kaurene oxidase